MPRPRLHPTDSKSPASKAAGVRRLARRVAQGTLLAASFASSQLSYGQRDAAVRLFDPTVVDKLSEPLSRHRQ